MRLPPPSRACSRWLFFFASLVLLAACCAGPRRADIRQSGPAGDNPKSVVLERGAVAAAEPRAARVGADILRRGGNAVDAAVAVQFALAVTLPYAGNIGGGGFMLVHDPETGDHALDFRETAPGKAGEKLFQDQAGNVVPGLSLHSRLAAGVPGTVRGMAEVFRRFGSGRISWREVLEPAIRLAEGGFVLPGRQARRFQEKADKIQALASPYRARINFADYFHGRAGRMFRQPELARTLQRIAEKGPDEFYTGETAELLVREQARGNGMITREDLAAYRPRWRAPVSVVYRGYRVVSMPPPSSGGVALAQLLLMLETWKELPRRNSPEHLHLVAEIEKRVFADRAAYLGDPDFTPVSVEALTDKYYCRRRTADIVMDDRSDPASIAAGEIKPYPAPDRRPTPRTESEETTHFSVVDRRGMAVSCTTTINAAYGSGIVVRGAGFLLNNEMDDFSAKPGVPNLYGVTGGKANSVRGNKRMLSSMSPTLVFRPISGTAKKPEDNSREDHRELWLVLGTPGGPTIFTTVFQVVVNRVDYGMPLADAVAAPRFHHQWPPRSNGKDAVYVEDLPGFTVDLAALESLRAMGYAIVPRGALGDVQALEISGGRVLGASDPRGHGAVSWE